MIGYRVVLADRFDGHHIIDFDGVCPDYPAAREELLAIHTDLKPILAAEGFHGYLRVEPVADAEPVMWQTEVPDIRPAVTL